MAADHVENVYKQLKAFITALSEYIAQEERTKIEINQRVHEHLAACMTKQKSNWEY